MKAITVCQPWAWLIVAGHKLIENRTWTTSYRGPLAIHAGKGRTHMNQESYDELSAMGIVVPDDLAFGAIVGVCELHDVRPHRAVKMMKFAEGPFCFMLRSIRAIEPIPCRGALSLWTPDQSIITAINEPSKKGK